MLRESEPKRPLSQKAGRGEGENRGFPKLDKVSLAVCGGGSAGREGQKGIRLAAGGLAALADIGHHLLERVDADGSYHTRWAQDGAEVRTDG